MLRCFAAVEVSSPAVRRALESTQFQLKRAFGPRDPVKWVPAHQFHFTLKFFGEIEEPAAQTAAEALGRAASATAPFTLEVAGLGAFPSPARPSVLWSGVGEGKEQLVDLARRVEEALAGAGFPREPRPFKPHLTLGRLREGAAAPPAVVQALTGSNASFGAWRVERLVLMKSELLPAGPRYSVLSEAHFREENG